MRDVRRWLGATAAVVSSVGSGCGNNVPMIDQSKAEARVTGIVTIHGKPMSLGTVTFNPMNAGRTDVTEKRATVKEGSFEITSLVGHNDVRISGPAVKNEPTLAYETKSVVLKPGDNQITLEYAK